MITEGSLQDFTLPDLLQILAQAKATGELSLRSEGRSATLTLSLGQIVAATVGEREGLDAAADLYLWQSGVFAFAKAKTGMLDPREPLPQDALASEGMRRLERWRELTRTLPAHFSLRTWVHPMQLYDPAPSALVASLGAGMTVAELLAARPESELVTLETLVRHFEADELGLSCAQEEQLRQVFERLAGAMFSRFASISGVRLVEGLESQLNEAARQAGLGLRWRAGKLTDSLPDDWRKAQLLAAYRPTVGILAGRIAQVYGPEFLARVLDEAGGGLPPAQRPLWDALLAETPTETPSR